MHWNSQRCACSPPLSALPLIFFSFFSLQKQSERLVHTHTQGFVRQGNPIAQHPWPFFFPLFFPIVFCSCWHAGVRVPPALIRMCVYVYVCVYVHACICICTYTFIYMYISRYVYTYLYMYIRICISRYRYAYIYICICIYVYIYLTIYIHICIYMYMYLTFGIYMCIAQGFVHHIHITTHTLLLTHTYITTHTLLLTHTYIHICVSRRGSCTTRAWSRYGWRET